MHTNNAQGTFARKEQKYLLDPASYLLLMSMMGTYLEPDLHGHAAVSSLYYDTPEFELVNRSIEKPLYKEKLRLRSYAPLDAGGLPSFDNEAPVFVELKKKFDGIVYKRRIPMELNEACAFMEGAGFVHAYEGAGVPPASPGVTAQIAAELQAAISRHPGLRPAMMIVVERLAFHAIEDDQLRITFDLNPRYRATDLDFASGFDGHAILEDGKAIMEVKCANAYPRWLIDALNAVKAYPQSCSKYGLAYQAAFRNQASRRRKTPIPFKTTAA